MAVEVDVGVWDRWAALSRRSGKPEIDLLLSGGCLPASVEQTVRDAFQRVGERLLEGPAAPADGKDEPSIGVWSFVRVPGGVAVVVRPKAELFAEVLGGLADELTAAGVDGQVEVYRWPDVVEAAGRGPFIEARVLVDGERFTYGYEGWSSRLTAIDALLHAALRWCEQDPGELGTSVAIGRLPPLPVDGAADLIAIIDSALPDHGTAQAKVERVSADTYRAVSFNMNHGNLTLLSGATVLPRPGWESVVDDLRAWVTEHASDIAYARIRRGADVHRAEIFTLPGWNPSDGPRDTLDHPSAAPMATILMPAPSGIQLLASELARRVQDEIGSHPDWTTTTFPDGRILLEHRDPTAWFEDPLTSRLLTDVFPSAQTEWDDLIVSEVVLDERRRWIDDHQPHVSISPTLMDTLRQAPWTLNRSINVTLELGDGRQIPACTVNWGGRLVRADGREDFDPAIADAVSATHI